MDQNYYAESLQDLSVRAERLRSNDETQLTPDEHSACRAGLGGLQWLAVQTEPDQIGSSIFKLLFELIALQCTSDVTKAQKRSF